MAPSSADMPGENILQNKVAGDLLFWTIFHHLKLTGEERAVLASVGFFETLFEDKGV